MPRTGRPKRTSWEKCKVTSCEKTVQGGAKGMCSTHYAQLRRGLLTADGKQARAPMRVRSYGPGARCTVDGCDRRPKGQGLCSFHHNKAIADGSIDPVLQKTVVSYASTASCLVESCTKRPVNKKMCSKHAQQRMAGILDENGVQLRALSPWKRKRKPGPIFDGAGYALVVPPEDYEGKTRQGRVLEHRLVLELHLGRLLESHEIVHHKNGDRKDNRLENLELMTQKEHPPAHEHTYDSVSSALDALRVSDPDSYNRVLQDRLQ